MAYDSYDRLRSNGEPGYFGNYQSDSDYSSHYASGPRNDPSSRRREDIRHRRSPSNDTRMPSDTASMFDSVRGDKFSAESLAKLTADITDSVRKQIYEELNLPGKPNESSSSRVPPMPQARSNRSSSSISPPPTARRVYTPPSPLQQPKSVFTAPQYEEPAAMRSPPASPMDKPGGVRFSERNFRPSVGRTYSTLELSTIDQKWGQLFDNQGVPTKRLGDALRGLANHLVSHFEPKGSIVVTPSKMTAYYEAYCLDKNEPHPLLSIFRIQSNEQISLLYRELECEHHLVQEGPSSAPTVPALTPAGFAHWMTVFIRAYPDEEWNRLEEMVPHLPVDADGDLVDGKPERLPKQISRHLLPERFCPVHRKLIDDAIANYHSDSGASARRQGSITNPPTAHRTSNSHTRPVEIHQSIASPTMSKIPPILERDRKPYSSAAVSSDEETGPINIERQRQPYSAQPGIGKVYKDDNNPSQPRRDRSDSTSTRTATREQFDRTAPRGRNHSNSTASQQYIPTPQRNRRTSSPPMKSFRNTAPENINDSSKYGPSAASSAFDSNAGSFGSTGSFPPPPGPPPININPRDDREKRRSRDERSPWAGTYNDEINSPRDAERRDRYRDEYERGSTDRGAPPEEWVRRDRDRNDDYNYNHRRY